MDKQEIRARTLKLRRKLGEEARLQKSRVIGEKVRGLEEYKKASLIFFYADYNCEVQTTGMIEQALAGGKRVALPRVEGKDLVFYEIQELSRLEKNKRGIREPVPGLCKPAKELPGLIVMPGAAFDALRNRIGYGGGYYDRYLCVRREVFTAALAFDCQIVEAIEAKPFDVRPCLVLTESRDIS